MTTPFVSIIIPNYNHARYLDERIQSVLNQTYQNFEIIILDDKSTDNSAEVIEKYGIHPKVSNIVINKDNSGSTFKQWHKGFELAKGELIWIAESDDSCDKTLLERNVKSFINDGNCVLSFVCSRRMDENGVLHNKMQNIASDSIMDGMDFCRKYLYCGNIILNASSALFKKNLAQKLDKRYMKYKGGGDRLFWIELAECGNVGIISNPLNYFRKHISNTTSMLYKDGTDFYEAKWTYDYIKNKHNISREESKRICTHYLYRIKYVEEFKSEEIRKDLVNYWNPDLEVRIAVLLAKMRNTIQSKRLRLKRLVQK